MMCLSVLFALFILLIYKHIFHCTLHSNSKWLFDYTVMELEFLLSIVRIMEQTIFSTALQRDRFCRVNNNDVSGSFILQSPGFKFKHKALYVSSSFRISVN